MINRQQNYQSNGIQWHNQIWLKKDHMQALETVLLLRVSQLLSHIMNPLRVQLLSRIHCLNLPISVWLTQQLDPPAEVEANTPILILLPSTPVKLAIGLAQFTNPWKFLQLRYTSCKYSRVPAVLWQQLLQHWGWQQSMALSASLMIGTKQLQYPVPVSASGTPNYWKITTFSGETTMSLLVPKACLKDMIMFATVLGGVLQFSISKSTPSNLYLVLMSERALMKLFVLLLLENTLGQLPFCPPIDISTFFPLSCQLATKSVGKLASSTRTLPLV